MGPHFYCVLLRSGARTRTLNKWTRTTCVANYTTPEGLDYLTGNARLAANRWIYLGDSRGPRTKGSVSNNAADADVKSLF